MLHGKRGFDRIVWAFRNVLNDSHEWLFCDLRSLTAEGQYARLSGSLILRLTAAFYSGYSGSSPLALHHPFVVQCVPSIRVLKGIQAPALQLPASTTAAVLREYCKDVAEWLGMVSLGSPRILRRDLIDPYLSRYEVPNAAPGGVDMVLVKWKGFLPASWITKLLLACL
jgi:ribonuclease P/MRP protein subunit RPP40